MRGAAAAVDADVLLHHPQKHVQLVSTLAVTLVMRVGQVFIKATTVISIRSVLNAVLASIKIKTVNRGVSLV